MHWFVCWKDLPTLCLETLTYVLGHLCALQTVRPFVIDTVNLAEEVLGPFSWH